MQYKERSKQTKNINWFVKQQVLTIAHVRFKERIQVETHVTNSSNQTYTY